MRVLKNVSLGGTFQPCRSLVGHTWTVAGLALRPHAPHHGSRCLRNSSSISTASNIGFPMCVRTLGENSCKRDRYWKIARSGSSFAILVVLFCNACSEAGGRTCRPMTLNVLSWGERFVSDCTRGCADLGWRPKDRKDCNTCYVLAVVCRYGSDRQRLFNPNHEVPINHVYLGVGHETRFGNVSFMDVRFAASRRSLCDSSPCTSRPSIGCWHGECKRCQLKTTRP